MTTVKLTQRSKNLVTSVLKGSKLVDWVIGNAQFRPQGVDYVVVSLIHNVTKGSTTYSLETKVRLPVDKPEDVITIDDLLRSMKYMKYRRKRK